MPAALQDLSRHIHEYLSAWKKKQSVHVEPVNAWFNCMQSFDVNPVHHHRNDGVLIMIGFLKLPDKLQQEHFEEIKLQKKGAARKFAGFLNLIHGSASNLSSPVFSIKPRVGEFYIFPSDVLHSVNPYSSDGERRTLAANFIFNNIHKNGPETASTG